MDSSTLFAEIEALRKENERLKALIRSHQESESPQYDERNATHSTNQRSCASNCLAEAEKQCELTHRDIMRYSRQMLVPAFGVASQEVLKQMKVLIVGAGGLGCPAGLYLATAGVGSLIIVDDDIVEESNLQRQVGHSECSVGVSKAESLSNTLRSINSTISITSYKCRFNARTSTDLLLGVDVVLDCTDNPATRYFINDACYFHGIPLVSGAALGSDGQLTTVNWNHGPCYRCLFPSPPPPEATGSCADSGVLGPITGVIGSLQALEVLKVAAHRAVQLLNREEQPTNVNRVIVENNESCSGECPVTLNSMQRFSLHVDSRQHPISHTPTMGQPLSSKLLLFDGSEGRFRLISTRGKVADCILCSSQEQHVQIRTLNDSEKWAASKGLRPWEGLDVPATYQIKESDVDVEECTIYNVSKVTQAAESTLDGQVLHLQLDEANNSTEWCPCDSKKNGLLSSGPKLPEMTVVELSQLRKQHEKCILVDVRVPLQYDICALSGSVPISMSTLEKAQRTGNLNDVLMERLGPEYDKKDILVLCRRGIDSTLVTKMLQDAGLSAYNVIGGLKSWSEEIDPQFPKY